MMDPLEKEEGSEGARPLGRLRKALLPAGVAVGASAAFIYAALRFRPTPKTRPQGPETPGGSSQGKVPSEQVRPPAPGIVLEREYVQVAVLGGPGEGAGKFQRSLSGVAVGPGDRVYALGDDQVKTFEPGGAFLKAWKAPAGSTCLAVGADGRVYLGAPGRVEIQEEGGAPAGGFAVGEPGKPAAITAVKLAGGEILVADASARFIRRFDGGGKYLGEIGTRNKTGCFILPNRSLDFALDPKGVVRATDTGRHQVTAWALDGAPQGAFGKFGQSSPEDFVGCCNPVNIAVGPAGEVITGEKAVSRVKVYTGEGKLLAVIGPENFDPACTSIHLAADSKGRILTADPVRREIKVFKEIERP